MKFPAIIHLDLDAFYAAVEVLDNPELEGQAVIVGGGTSRGVVSSASYPARKFGVHSAQPTAVARRLCPHGVFLPVRMRRYKEVSDQVFEIFRRFTPLVEPVSIDEAFLDVTGLERLFGPPEEIARQIKKAVLEETGLTISAGVAPSKMVAKIASGLNKPDGLTVVPPERVREFLEPLPLGKLWGVGRVTLKALTLLGVHTLGDLSRLPLEALEKRFGQHGRELHQLSLGRDDREVVPGREVKSLGHEETFAKDLRESGPAQKELLALAVRVGRRARSKGFLGRRVTLKVKYSDFAQITRSSTLPEPTDDSRTIFEHCRQLLEKTQVGRRPVRLLGVSLSQLSVAGQEGQIPLFPSAEEDKSKRLTRALDAISEKYGEKAILPGTLLQE